jgi:hypothetical protein
VAHRRKEEHGKKLRRKGCRKTDRWRILVVDKYKVEMSYEDGDCSLFNITYYVIKCGSVKT